MPSSIYLCGPITGCTFEEAKHGWRKQVYDALTPLGIICYSPLRHQSRDEMPESNSLSMSPNGAGTDALSTAKGLTQRDRFDTFRSNLIFCNLLGTTQPSIGSMIEFGWADAMRIPIVCCMEEGNIHHHGMVVTVASWVVPTLEEGIAITKALLNSNL